MKLVGHYLSPFTRRVGVSLHALGVPFELQFTSTVQTPEKVRLHNPLVRIPALVLDDGEALVESYAILDEIDQMVGPDRALVPAAGRARRRVMQVTAIALACMDKQQWAFYERRFRPEEKVHQPWIDHNESQSLGGLRHLEKLASQTGSGWLADTPRLSQADITTAVVVSFIVLIRPELKEQLPHLCRFTDFCEALPAFRSAPMPPSQPGRPGYVQLPS